MTFGFSFLLENERAGLFWIIRLDGACYNTALNTKITVMNLSYMVSGPNLV